MKLLTLDVATNTGWAVWDMDRSESSILTGTFHCESKSAKWEGRREKCVVMRSEVRRLMKEHKPDIVVMEQPLEIGPDHGRLKELVAKAKAIKAKGGSTDRMLRLILNFADTTPKKKRPELFQGAAEADDEVQVSGGQNANTQSLSRELFMAAWSAAYGLMLKPIHEVQPREWQAITKKFPGQTTKDRSVAGCQMLRIQLASNNKKNREDAADAAMIAVWAKGNLQKLKLLQQAKEAEAA